VIGTGVEGGVIGETGTESRVKAGDLVMEGSDMDPVRPVTGLWESREPTLLTDPVGDDVEDGAGMVTVANHNRGQANDVICSN